MACRDEFEELLFYVVELKDKLNAKLDEQCAKINQQAAIVLQQGQIIDELCWQLRELSEKTRELRTENQTLRTRVDRLEVDAGTYQNHVAERYNELTKVQSHTKERPKVTVEYAQVDKTATSKKWPLRGQKTPSTPEDQAVNSGNTTWYLDLVESIYEPIQLSAKPTTAARLEQISAQVSSTTAEVPKPAPRRRLYPTVAMENLAAYFGEVGSRSTITVERDSPAEEVLLRSQDVQGRFREKEQLVADSKVVAACSRLENLDKIHLPEEQYLTDDNLVRFTINSRPATMAPTATDKTTVDQRRHAIRSYI